MSDPSLASPRCPKCFAVVGEEDQKCPRCSFDFASLERAQTKPKTVAKPKKTLGKAAVKVATLVRPVAAVQAEVKPIPAKSKPAAAPKPEPIPNLEKEIPFRWSPPTAKTAAPKAPFPWARAGLLCALVAVVSLIGLAGFSNWAALSAAMPVLDAHDAPASSDALDVLPQGASAGQDDPFPRRPLEDQDGARKLADAFSGQLRAMNAAL